MSKSAHWVDTPPTIKPIPRRIEHRLRESGLPLEKSLTTLDLDRLSPRTCAQFATLRDGSFIDHRENVLVFGAQGSGKTHFLCALGQELLRQDRRVYYTTGTQLVQKLLLAQRQGTITQVLTTLKRYELLLIDDLCDLELSRSNMYVLFQFVDTLYEQRSVLITSALPFSKWHTIFKDPGLAEKLIDRLVHHSSIILLNQPNYWASGVGGSLRESYQLQLQRRIQSDQYPED